jgi:hypothetical protein
VFLPLLAFTFGPHERLLHLACWSASRRRRRDRPPAILDRLAQRRQTRIRKSIPDSLDLLVVCVEAGTGLDSAMLRVARDMAALHPELAGELFVVNRRMNAGLGRAEALQGLAKRTGVEQLRGLASSMIQSERLGSSIARVLRVYSETLRRQRKQAAEKRAAPGDGEDDLPARAVHAPVALRHAARPGVLHDEGHIGQARAVVSVLMPPERRAR